MSVGKDCCKHYYLMKTLKTDIVTVAFYGTILALGGENGRLFLYYISSEEHLISVDLSKPNSTLQLSEASIISIDITCQDNSPVIAASTNDSIHIVKWYKLSTSHQKVRRRELTHLFAWFILLSNNTCLRFCDNCKFCMNVFINNKYLCFVKILTKVYRLISSHFLKHEERSHEISMNF